MGKIMTWQGRKAISIDGVTMQYDYNGKRLCKGDKKYFWQGDTLKYEYDNNGYIYYYHDDNGMCGMNVDGIEYYFRKNIFGDIIGIYDIEGNMLCKYTYDAWGKHTITDAQGKAVTAENIGNKNPYRYRGYYYDTEFGLYYLQSRYYDPETGRFINADDVSYLDPQTIGGLNLFAYCNNNPVMYTDPLGTGLLLAALLASIAIGAVIGGATSGYIAYKEGLRGRNLCGAILGGAILGGAMGAVTAIGGAAGLASLGLTATVVGGSTAAAFGISIGIGVAAGFLSYTTESLIRTDMDWNVGSFIQAGVSGGLQAAVTFGMAYLGGRLGINSKELAGKVASDFMMFVVDKTGRVSIGQAIVYGVQFYLTHSVAKLIFVSLPTAILRSLIGLLKIKRI